MADFEYIQAASDKESYTFVRDQDLALIVAIEEEIKAGKTPEQIADFWRQEYKRDKMTKRIHHAARHIYREARNG